MIKKGVWIGIAAIGAGLVWLLSGKAKAVPPEESEPGLGTLIGQVMNQQGKPIKGARINIPVTYPVDEGLSDENGNYFILNIIPSYYRVVSCGKGGYLTTTTDITIKEGENILNFTLISEEPVIYVKIINAPDYLYYHDNPAEPPSPVEDHEFRVLYDGKGKMSTAVLVSRGAEAKIGLKLITPGEGFVYITEGYINAYLLASYPPYHYEAEEIRKGKQSPLTKFEWGAHYIFDWNTGRLTRI